MRLVTAEQPTGAFITAGVGRADNLALLLGKANPPYTSTTAADEQDATHNRNTVKAHVLHLIELTERDSSVGQFVGVGLPGEE